MIALLGVACAFAGGIWLVASAVWPAPRSLSSALSHLNSTARNRLGFVSVAGHDESPAVAVGRWLLRHAKATTLADEQTASDLDLLGRPLEVYAGTRALVAIGGALVGPVLWTLAAAVGTPLPIVMPLWMRIVGALGGWFLPRVVLHGEAEEARVNFRHALGAYLDILVLLLAAQEGPESAMEIASAAGQGPAFDELRRATFHARLSGDAVWDALDDVGRRLRIPELREIAAAGSLAGESGAAVRQSLTAKARSLRQSALAEAETSARKKSQAMFMPLILMGMGFVVFLIYPMVTNLSVGGGTP